VFVALVRDVWNINIFMAEQQNHVARVVIMNMFEIMMLMEKGVMMGDVLISNWDLEQTNWGLI